MKRLLFVDDEPKVLDGLRRMLHPHRREWQMEFAGSGPEALEILDAAPFDVLVTDICMPGMDGAKVLEEVRRRFPRIVRIALSGQCTRDTMFRLVSLAHRHLTKPCDANTLKEAVTRAGALQEQLNSPSLLGLVSRLESVPSAPALYLEVVKELESREPSLKQVARIISRDPGMAAKILQVANSALFGQRSRVATPERAVTLLGTETTRTLVLAANIFSRIDPAVVAPFAVEDLWSHSLRTSALARRIAREVGGDEAAADTAALAGLLHDVGKLILVTHEGDAYRRVEGLCRDGLSACDAEREVFGATHAGVGAYVLGLWGLATPVVEAVAWHHDPEGCPVQEFSSLGAVHVANALDHDAAGSAGNSLNVRYVERLGLSGRLDAWRALRETATTEAR